MLFVDRFYNSLRSLINLEIRAMSNNSKNQDSEGKERQTSLEEDLDLQLDDFDDEIIDLVDPLEGEGAESDDSSVHDETWDDEDDLSFEDFDVEMELGEDEPSKGSMMEPLEDEEESKTDSWKEIENERGKPFGGEDETSKAAAGESDEGIKEDDPFSDEALAELFASHESEVAKLLEEATGCTVEDEKVPSAEAVSVSEEELPEDLFADLEMEAEEIGEEGDAPESASVSEEELPEDLFADLEMEAEEIGEEGDAPESASVSEEELPEDLFADLELEAEGIGEEGDAPESASVSEEELPEDLFADLELEAEGIGEEGDTPEAPSAVGEEVSAEVVSDFERELDSVIDETVAAASALASEEEPQSEVTDFEAETEKVSQMDIFEEIAPAAAEELATLVSVQVEEVVTRLVEQRLPAIVERLVAQEIEKIRSSLEPGE